MNKSKNKKKGRLILENNSYYLVTRTGGHEELQIYAEECAEKYTDDSPVSNIKVPHINDKGKEDNLTFLKVNNIKSDPPGLAMEEAIYLTDRMSQRTCDKFMVISVFEKLVSLELYMKRDDFNNKVINDIELLSQNNHDMDIIIDDFYITNKDYKVIFIDGELDSFNIDLILEQFKWDPTRTNTHINDNKLINYYAK